MYTVEDIRKEYDRLDALLGVDTRHIELSISGRLSSKLGYFKIKGRRAAFGRFADPTLCITIAKGICEDKEQFYETIRHEYAHALVYLRTKDPGHGHDAVWKQACRLVGCTPRARSNIENKETREKLNKYTITCKDCGFVAYYKRDCRTLQIVRGDIKLRGGKLKCPQCGNSRLIYGEL